jgi:FtsP/CotA-like multicopper oxidase with cupredoxin domain
MRLIHSAPRGPAILLAALTLVTALAATAFAAGVPMDPDGLVKYLDPLPIPGAMPAVADNYYEIGMFPIEQQLHSQLPPTRLWGYGTSAATASYPAATIEARRGVPVRVRWTNHLPATHLLEEAIDHTLHMAHAENGVPAVTHLHGGEVEPASDGGPDAWFTPGFAEKGMAWQKETFEYANDQLPATLWYHDHALGITRLNVYAGLAGFYLLRDPVIEDPLNLPQGRYEIPLVIQDRNFDDEGQLEYPVGGDNPEIHPIWQPEFFGDVILVNGKVWPYLEVEPRKYRFRMLDGSNARFYSLWLVEEGTNIPGPGFWQIGSDGGYLDTPVLLNDPSAGSPKRLVMAPGERADIVIDFSGYAPGTRFVMRNNARSPFPNGETVDPQTTGQIMQFRVVAPTGPDESSIATPGPGYVTRLSGETRTRRLTLDEVMGPNGPVEALLNRAKWDDAVTELPTLGSTEVWEIVNTTADAHPIHLHLVQFQILNRQKFQTARYSKLLMDGMPGMETPDVTPYLVGQPKLPPPEEMGWKDTFKMYPGEVTRVIIRFAPQAGTPDFAFDATAEPGYVWHCHILEHEDNEMMRPYRLVAPGAPQPVASMAAAADAVPVTFALRAGPNPTAAGADIHLSLPQAGPAKLRVFDLGGRLVRGLSDGAFAAGTTEVRWDGNDDAGRQVPAGIYFVTFDGAAGRRTTKLVVTH